MAKWNSGANVATTAGNYEQDSETNATPTRSSPEQIPQTKTKQSANERKNRKKPRIDATRRETSKNDVKKGIPTFFPPAAPFDFSAI